VRVERAHLIELARREVETRAADDGLLAAYLIGTVVSGEPLLGGSADIDLVLIHDDPPPQEREVVPLSPDVHLDIAHHARLRYSQPRRIRVDPWLGPAVYAPLTLYDREHLFEWAQAGSRGQYNRPDHSRERSSGFLASARRLRQDLATTPVWPTTYLSAVMAGANAVAGLAGPPACGRRALLVLEARLAHAGHAEIYPDVLQLLGADRIETHTAPDWVASWARAYDAAAHISADPLVSSHRRAYYLKGFQALLEEGAAPAFLPVLIKVWERAIGTLSAFNLDADHRDAWRTALEVLGLGTDTAEGRSAALEAFLDRVELILELWGREHGA
jgi:hypothetical protein